jgi:hypothetical protein
MPVLPSGPTRRRCTALSQAGLLLQGKLLPFAMPAFARCGRRKVTTRELGLLRDGETVHQHE